MDCDSSQHANIVTVRILNKSQFAAFGIEFNKSSIWFEWRRETLGKAHQERTKKHIKGMRNGFGEFQ